MQRFYERIRGDGARGRFYADCARCGCRRYGGRIPLLCRNALPLLEAGGGARLLQALYNWKRTAALRRLSRFFNRCIGCGHWVCDDCFDSAAGRGLCHDCAQKSSQ